MTPCTKCGYPCVIPDKQLYVEASVYKGHLILSLHGVRPGHARYVLHGGELRPYCCIGCAMLAIESPKPESEPEPLNALLERSGYDLSPCIDCGRDTICLPDGIAPRCKECHDRECLQ